MDVRGVAEQKHPVLAKTRSLSPVDAEYRRPSRIAEPETVETALIDPCLALRKAGLVMPVGRRIDDDEPPAILRQREKRQCTVTLQPDLRLGMVEVAGNLHIGQNEMLRVGGARERNSQLLANCAVRPVTAEEPISLEFLDSVSGVQAGRDARLALCQRNQLGAALDPHPEPGETLLENAFRLVLRHPQDKRISRFQHAERRVGDASALAVHVDPADAVTGAQESVGESHQLERLDGSRVDSDRPRLHRAVRGLVDQAALDPIAREFMRHDQSGRTRSDDQRFRPFAHGTLHFIPMTKCRAVAKVPVLASLREVLDPLLSP